MLPSVPNYDFESLSHLTDVFCKLTFSKKQTHAIREIKLTILKRSKKEQQS